MYRPSSRHTGTYNIPCRQSKAASDSYTITANGAIMPQTPARCQPFNLASSAFSARFSASRRFIVSSSATYKSSAWAQPGKPCGQWPILVSPQCIHGILSLLSKPRRKSFSRSQASFSGAASLGSSHISIKSGCWPWKSPAAAPVPSQPVRDEPRHPCPPRPENRL